MFFVSNLPSSSQAGCQSTCEESGRTRTDKRVSVREDIREKALVVTISIL